jgi:magnesium transporter
MDMIAIHCWNQSTKSLETIPPDDLLRRREELLSSDRVVWIDLCESTEEEDQLVYQQFFCAHTLTLEDITKQRREPDGPPHLPKVEEFPDYLFAIVNPLVPNTHERIKQVADHEHGLTQLSAVLTHTLLITHHVHALPCVQRVREYVQRHAAHMARGPDFVFHLILDNTVDEFVPALDAIEATLDHLESSILHRPRQALFLHLVRLKRIIIVLRKTLISEREVLVRLARGEFDLIDERETVYYRNVYDHLARYTELIEGSREMVSDLMQTFLSAQANHLNQIMKVLTMISTIVLPMTLIAGVYGMNFKQLTPDTENEKGFLLALGMMAISGLGSLVFFWWKRWM